MIRITSGKWRTRSLYTLNGTDTRPTASRTREAVFSMLFDRVTNARCCDLFAGSGCMGIEALSRGAQSVDFVDNNPAAVSVIERNLHMLGVEARPICADAIRFLNNAMPYDIFFLDPPYKTDLAYHAVEVIYQRNLLAQNGVIVLEQQANTQIFESGFNLVKSRKYGKAQILIFEGG